MPAPDVDLRDPPHFAACEEAARAGHPDACIADDDAILPDLAARGGGAVSRYLGLVRQVRGPDEALARSDRWIAAGAVRPEDVWPERLQAWLERGDRDAALRELPAGRPRSGAWDAEPYAFWSYELGVRHPPYSGWTRYGDGRYTVISRRPQVCRTGGLLASAGHGQLSIGAVPASEGETPWAFTAEREAILGRELQRVGIDDAGPIELVVYPWIEAISTLPGRAAYAHGNFATPELHRAHWTCGRAMSVHEDVHVVLARFGGLRLDPLFSEGFATALDGRPAAPVTPELLAYAAGLASLDDLWLAASGDPELVATRGRPPVDSYALAGSFCAYLLTRLPPGGLDVALRSAGTREGLLRGGFGLGEDEALAGWQRWLATRAAEGAP